MFPCPTVAYKTVKHPTVLHYITYYRVFVNAEPRTTELGFSPVTMQQLFSTVRHMSLCEHRTKYCRVGAVIGHCVATDVNHSMAHCCK
jgi:hypothetical protein